MKGTSHPGNDVSLNTSTNTAICEVIDRVPVHRRSFVRTGLSAAPLATADGPSRSGPVQAVHAAPIAPGRGFRGIGFERIPARRGMAPGTASAVLDRVTVSAGCSAERGVARGDASMPGGTLFSGQADRPRQRYGD